MTKLANNSTSQNNTEDFKSPRLKNKSKNVNNLNDSNENTIDQLDQDTQNYFNDIIFNDKKGSKSLGKTTTIKL